MRSLKIKEVEYDEYDCDNTDEAVCPYCGHENYVEGEDYTQNDDQEEMECGECCKTFMYSTNYIITQTTEPYENYYISYRKNLEEQRKRYELNVKGNHNDEYYIWCLQNTENKILQLDKDARAILGLE